MSRRQYEQYGKASQRCSILILIHYNKNQYSIASPCVTCVLSVARRLVLIFVNSLYFRTACSPPPYTESRFGLPDLPKLRPVECFR